MEMSSDGCVVVLKHTSSLLHHKVLYEAFMRLVYTKKNDSVNVVCHFAAFF